MGYAGSAWELCGKLMNRSLHLCRPVFPAKFARGDKCLEEESEILARFWLPAVQSGRCQRTSRTDFLAQAGGPSVPPKPGGSCPFSLGSQGLRKGERGEKDSCWKDGRSPLRGRRYKCLFWQAEGPSVWAKDTIIDFSIDEFGDGLYFFGLFCRASSMTSSMR
jgi:hypothetical protein